MPIDFGNSQKFSFDGLFVFEMANNHQGSVDHGKKIISEMAKIAKDKQIKAAVKLQFRDLDTFIHPKFKDAKDVKHVPRFLSTRLNEKQFGELVQETKRQGLVSMCTPFDEPSVDMIERLDVEVIKIGSCSAHDWPLLERVAETGKPVICSTGGLRLQDIDRIVSFFQHRGVHFALMHCVAMYPTPTGKLHLNQIAEMRRRYPHVTIGFSTHEAPSDTTIVGLAYAKGARMFEKHVGVATDKITLNTYSATPEQTASWVDTYLHAKDACGHEGEREIGPEESADLRSLMRGVYVKNVAKKGSPIGREDVFFAMPAQEGQLISGNFKEGMIADKEYRALDPVSADSTPATRSPKDVVYKTIREVKAILNYAHISLGHEFAVELSHHYGIDHFHSIGCVIVECFNREYAKKLIVQMPGQWNPVHYHKQKDETFQILWGVLDVEIEGHRKRLYPGDTLWVPRGTWHGFGTETGVVFEEVSTTAIGGDSYYVDKKIAKIERESRKTRLSHWGRYQFDLEAGE